MKTLVLDLDETLVHSIFALKSAIECDIVLTLNLSDNPRVE